MSDSSLQQRLDEVFSSFQGRAQELIPVLQAVQREFGYLSGETMLAIANFLRIPASRVFGVATFYAQFRFSAIGRKHIMACRGTACHVRGAPRIVDEIKNILKIEEGETTADGEYSLETVACIGCCGLAPCIMINGEVKAKLTPKKIAELFAKKE
ncbi:MAG: NADH-quinone oxidoreductase subunit NuoE [Gammaproteobacteria bacterium]|nr:NADH-quinone oxidoreductase subunit NuoE [Gammaproteobacteria bacterium]